MSDRLHGHAPAILSFGVRLILASASPRRAELLANAGFDFDTCVTDVDETVRPGEGAIDYVRRLAVEKSARALQLLDARGAADPFVIVAADTAVVVDEAILGKPVDEPEAGQMLRRLSGRAHVVMTGVSVRTRFGQLDRVEQTRVVVQPLSEADVEWYIASDEGRDKAGGYAIQGRASRFIPRIEGSYSNVVGLPVATVAEMITQLGTSG
jgi:septum formation protein